MLHVICTRLRPSHFSVHVGDGSRSSETIVKISICAFECDYYYYHCHYSSSAIDSLQIRSSVLLIPQNHLFGSGLLPSPTAWSQSDQHHADMFAYVSRHILGRTEGRRGRQRKQQEDKIKEWTGLEWYILLPKAENREEWRKLVVKSTVVPQRSARPRDR